MQLTHERSTPMSRGEVYLSVIVPAYNEARGISATLARLSEYLADQSFTHEILVVLDGPTDETREVVRRLAMEIHNLRVIDRAVNRGKGYTVREGMLKAVGEVRLFTDADNSTDIAHFDKMKAHFDNGCDLVIASRNDNDAPGARQAVPQPWYKRVIGQIGNGLVQLFAVRGIWDTQCGFKAFRAGTAAQIFSQTTIDGWGFDIEVLALARALNCKIGIVPARWVNDPQSHLRLFDYLRALGDTLRVRFNLLSRRYKL